MGSIYYIKHLNTSDDINMSQPSYDQQIA